MINKLFSILALGGMLASCNENSKTTDAPPQESENIMAAKASSSCFAFVNQKDTITLHLNLKGNVVDGELVYNLFEKDKNTGSFNGVMKGDTLFADYKFMSEGISSVREVAFLKKGNDFMEGYGEAGEINGKMVFKNKGALNFESKIILTKVECNAK